MTGGELSIVENPPPKEDINDLSDIINEIKKKIEVSEAAEKQSRQHSQTQQVSMNDSIKEPKEQHSKASNISISDQFKFVADAISFTNVPNPKNKQQPSAVLINRLDTKHYTTQPMSKKNNNNTGLNLQLQGGYSGELPGTVPEHLSREEYSQLDTPQSRSDSILIKKADVRLKTVESQGNAADDDEQAKSLQEMKNTAAKLAG